MKYAVLWGWVLMISAFALNILPRWNEIISKDATFIGGVVFIVGAAICFSLGHMKDAGDL